MNTGLTGNAAAEKQLPPDSGDAGEPEVEQLIAFARDYFAGDFPNPTRTGCAPQEALQTLARSGELPKDDLCEHIGWLGAMQ